MASISSLSSSSGTSSLYNSANIISGLASGMDTEGMIESLVQSYQNKIQTLNNKATKLQWKQDSYRNIISKMTGFASKYTSYTSSTNLLSASFFNSAVKVAALGKNGEKVTASGRTDSDVVLNSVSQLATAARYVTTGGGLKGDSGTAITADGSMKFDDKVTLGTLSGSLGFTYGSKTVSISFDEVADRIGLDDAGNEVNLTTAQKTEKLAELINEKLGNEKITLSSGESVAADTRIGVKVDEKTGSISFFDKAGAGNSVYISSASDSVKSTLGLGKLDDSDNRVSDFKVSDSTRFTKNIEAYEYLSGKSININLDGVTKSIQMPKIEKLAEPDADGNRYKLTMPSTVKDKFGNVSYVYDTSKLDKSKYTVTKQGDTASVKSTDDIAAEYTRMLQDGVQKAFGNKVTVTNEAAEKGALSLKFEVPEGSNLLINTSVGETLGIGRTATNYLNTSETLKDLMTSDAWKNLEPMKGEDGLPLRDEKTGKALYNFEINGVSIGHYTEDAKLSDIMSDINSNSEAGVKVSYSKTTREFVFNSKETGSQNQIKLGDGLASSIFGKNVDTAQKTADVLGEDLKGGLKNKTFDMTVNGKNVSFKFQSDSGSLQQMIDKVNNHLKGSGMEMSVSDRGTLVVKDAKGNEQNVTFGENDEVASKIFDKLDSTSGYTAGQDAKFKITVNGSTRELTRGSNSVEIDGMTINFNETFNYDKETGTYGEDTSENVSFKINTDSDKIVDAVKSMITDYNEMMAEIRSAYATMPYQDSSGAFKSYEPLTEEQKSGMSESEIKNYEERAKQGILFGDSNLRALYERMRDVFQPSGADAATLSKIGISVSFSSADNSTSITLDENKLREALENDPDQVTELFTRTGESGVSSNGLMQGLKTQLDRYAGLTGATKGILVQQAGTPLNSLSLLDNQWQKQIDNLGTEIEKWQDKLESQVDRYTSMFSKLEVLINQMNSQSSTLAGLMGG